MNIELTADKYRPTYQYASTPNGVKVKTINPDGTIVDRLISDKEFNEQVAYYLKNGYNIQVR